MTTRTMILVTLVLLLIAGSARAQEETLTAPELARLAAVQSLLADHANEVWQGWGTTPIPLLVRKGAYDYLVGDPAPPEDFEIVPDLRVGDTPVYRMSGHLTPGPVATSWPVGDGYAVAIPTMAEFQAAIDQALGPGVVVLDDATYVRAAVHEAFHAYQWTVREGIEGMPDFVLSEEDLPDAALAAEGQALRAALEAESLDDARRSAAEFLALRQERRAEVTPEAGTAEQGVEWIEGTARYAELSLMLLADDATLRLSDADWAAFLDQLAAPEDIPGGVRDRYYVLGAGQGFVLDRLLPGWQDRALIDGTPLDTLLAEAVQAHD